MAFNKLQVCTSLLIISTVTIVSAFDVSTGINTFTNRLYKIIKSEDNLIFSPFSAHSCLSLAYAGSGGETLVSFQKVLNLPSITEASSGYKDVFVSLSSVENINISIANKIYVQKNYTLSKEFQSVAVTDFDAGVDNIDFTDNVEAAKQINNWVEEKTKNMIHDVFQPENFDGSTRAVLLNAIYFKGNWLSPFSANATSLSEFHVTDTKTVAHPMMTQTDSFSYKEHTELDAKILKMEYEDTRFAMFIILPNSVTGITTLEEKVVNIDLSTLMIKTAKETVTVTLPKFKIESNFELNQPLTEVGLGEIFTPVANFSNMIEGVYNLEIRTVIQRALIEVNEEGAKAAAVTGGIAGAVSGMVQTKPPPSFIADHPFLFFITAKFGEQNTTSDTVLFVGKLLFPSSSVAIDHI